MGLGIGNIPAALSAGTQSASRPSPVELPDRPGAQPFEPQGLVDNAPESGGTRTGLAVPDDRPISAPAAALFAINRGVEAARDAVPTFEELRAQFQSNRVEARVESDVVSEADRAEATEQRESVEPDPGIRQPEPQAANAFFDTLQFSEPAPPVEFASARPPEAPDLATAERSEPVEFTPPEPANAAPAPEPAQARLDILA